MEAAAGSLSKRRRCASKGPPPDAALERQGGAAPASTQENETEEMAIVPAVASSASAMAMVRKIIEHHKCPITHQLLVDPVVAEDGHVYERRALETWLVTKRTSPTTNRPMGCAVVPALSARQTVSDLVEEGMLDTETSLNFFNDRGRLRATRTTVPGPDLDGAKKDFQRALTLAKSPTERKAAEFQLEAVAWMQEGAALCVRSQRLQSEAGGQSFDLRNWMLDLGDAARSAVTGPLLEAMRMSEWEDLPKGSRVRALDDAGELQRLCERPPAEAEAKVGWNAEMLGFAGKVCTVQRVGDASHKNYILRREAPPAGRDFSFPYDALFLLERP